jgi:excisionase family DNA binding protein
MTAETAAKVLDNRHARGRRDQIKFFTIAEVAECLRVADRTVRRWTKAGDLVTYRFGGAVRVAERDLRAFLALHRDGYRSPQLSRYVNHIGEIGNTHIGYITPSIDWASEMPRSAAMVSSVQ